MAGALDDPFYDAEMFSAEDSSEMALQKMVFEGHEGEKLYCRYWKPAGPPRALVSISHGFAEHLLPYHEVAQKLASNGCLVFGHDHRGHGRSSGNRAAVSTVRYCVFDVISHVQRVKVYYFGLPVFLIGHSMGGLIALLAAMQEPHLFRGIVLVGPLVKMRRCLMSPIAKGLAKALGTCAPNLQMMKVGLSGVTGNKEMQVAIKSDPLWWNHGMKACTARALYRGMDRLAASLGDLFVPMLIIHGEEDRICSPRGSKLLFVACRSSDKELKIVPKAKHHLYLETTDIRELAIGETVDWIMSRI